MTQFVKGGIQATLITGTVLSVAGIYMFAILTAMGRKQGLPLRPKWFLPLFDYVFFPSRLAEDGLRARKRCFLSAGVALFFILCDIFILWTHPI
jgi:hypothetical protein